MHRTALFEARGCRAASFPATCLRALILGLLAAGLCVGSCAAEQPPAPNDGLDKLMKRMIAADRHLPLIGEYIPMECNEAYEDWKRQFKKLKTEYGECGGASSLLSYCLQNTESISPRSYGIAVIRT